MQIIQIQPKEHIIQIDNWQEYLRDGEQFLKTAVAAHEKGRKAFSTEALYNITAMAIEKFIMAFLMTRGDLAENHTMADLAFALERHTGPLPELSEKLLFLGSFQDICNLEISHYAQPSQEEIGQIIAIGKEVKRLLSPFLYMETPG